MSAILKSSLLGLLALTVVFGISGPARVTAAEDLAEFAQCIGESGATFYGAHWCPYCRKQMAAFGDHADRLPYRECYRAGSRDRLSGCEHVQSYPTWEFADGTVRTGMLSFEALSALTDCELP